MEQKNNTIKLFLNKFKTADKHPVLKGSAVVDGKEYDASAWKNTDKNGNPWFNITLEEPYDKKTEVTYDSGSTNVSADEDIPF